MENQQQQQLELEIRTVLGAAPPANFEAWKEKNYDVLDSLGSPRASQRASQLVSVPHRIPWRLWRISLASTAAVCVVIAICWVLFPREHAFAATVRGINEAQTATWIRTSYMRGTSKDKKRRWLRKMETRSTYMTPGYFCFEDYDEDGELTRTSIDDPVKKQRLTLYHARKIFEIKDHEQFENVVDDKPKEVPKMNLAKFDFGPFGWFNRAVTEGGEIVGQRIVDGRKVNVLRWHNLAMGIHNEKNVSDVWIDTETEKIVGTCQPGSSVFDPEDLDYRDNAPEDEFSSMKILGSITKDIVLAPKIDPEIFAFNIPIEFSKAPQSKSVMVTETELIEWLEILAKINDGQFVDGVITRNTEKIADSSADETPSELEEQKRTIWMKHHLNGNSMPLWDFIDANTFANDYRYFGKGVKLGAADKAVLIYRLKLTGKYRVVYGDLRIEDFSDDEIQRLKDELAGTK